MLLIDTRPLLVAEWEGRKLWPETGRLSHICFSCAPLLPARFNSG
jgi:hypothetical protein